MSSVKWLNKLLFLEAFLGIYRNYCTHKRIVKYLILFQIFIQSSLLGIVVIIRLSSIWHSDIATKNAFSFLSVVVGLVTIATTVYSVYTSETFMTYYYNIYRISQYFKQDKKMFNTIKRVYGFCTLFTIFLVVYTISRSIEDLIITLTEESNILLWVIAMTSEEITKTTLISQQLMLYVGIMILVVLTKCLASLVSMIRNGLEGNEDSLETCDVTGQQIQDWVDVYRDLTDSCEKLTLCFGRPVSVG